eukprot:jgi/Bigna1/65667/fgenesh1_kg.122_\
MRRQRGQAAKIRFIQIQLSAFIISCCSMAFYGLGVVNLFQQVAIEAVLLAIRCSNEIWSRRFDIDDFIHHSAMILGSALITFHDPFKPYAYLLVHSQILHVPMAVFYYRKLLTNIYFDNRGSGNCATKSKRMTSLPSPPPPPPLIARRQVMFAESGFRVFWLFCTGLRSHNIFFRCVVVHVLHKETQLEKISEFRQIC